MDLQYEDYLKKIGEYGIVTHVSHPIVFIEGLPKVKTHEIVVFDSGQRGEVFSITRGRVEVRTFTHDPVKVGAKVTRTDELLSLPVGNELFGHTINPLGVPLDPTIKYTPPKERRELDVKPAGISGRYKLNTPLATGVTLVDLMVPLGQGQRELVIGDRKTGKTSLLMTTVRKQVDEGLVCIYACIGKKKSDIKKLQTFFESEGIIDKVIIVATSSFDSPSLIYHTPYAAMSIAEYFRDKGRHSLVVLDDLSTHAKFYRELSLLAKRFPGRDSYPGDVFYIHSKLLERSGNFKHPEFTSISITCLPVIEIVEGDFTGYIATNVMGITDGHIYFDSNQYSQGMRPAINIPLSVTRVGRQVMDKLSREVNKELTAFLSSYEKNLALSHFGQELTDDVKRSLRIGELIYKFFNQPYQQTVPIGVQMVILSMIMQDLIKDADMLQKTKLQLIRAYTFPHFGGQRLLFEVKNTHDIKVFHANVLKQKEKLLTLGYEPEPKKPEAAPPLQAPPPAAQPAPNQQPAPAATPPANPTQQQPNQNK